MNYVLKTDGLTKKYGTQLALNEVSMTVRPGDIYGFIGKNGAGKTTLMRIALGTAMPTSGTVRFFDGLDLSESRNMTGSLLENPCLYKSCSAYENLKRFAMLTGNSKAEIISILETVGLADTKKKTAGQFSLGMKQRLGIGIALLGHPKFLVLDEPLNGLDPAGIKDVRDLILKLNREQGITFLVSSHLLDELSKIVTRYGIINSGRLVEEISSEELLKSCRSCIKVTTSLPEEAAKLLSDFGHTEITGDTISIFDHSVDSAEINRALVSADIPVSELVNQSGGLEDYFIERIGR